MMSKSPRSNMRISGSSPAVPAAAPAPLRGSNPVSSATDPPEIVGHPVHRFLFVKVRENWGDDPDRYREMGLEFPKE